MDWENIFFITVIVLSVIFRVGFNARHRFIWTPIAFAIVLVGECGMLTMMRNWIVYQFVKLGITIAKAYLLCGFIVKPWQRNTVVVFFWMFWLYFLFSLFLGEFCLVSTIYYLKSLEFVILGFYAGMWAMETPGGLNRLLLWGAIAAGITALCWIRGGGVLAGSLVESAGGRVGVDETKVGVEAVEMGLFNVNGIGLKTSAVIGYAFLVMFLPGRSRMNKLMSWISVGITLLLAIIILRTGARNSAMAFLPMSWYLVFAKVKLSPFKRWGVILIVSFGMLYMISHYMSGAKSIRAFDFSSEDGDNFGSGRLGWFRDVYSEMGEKRFWGAGAKLDTRRGINVGNMHSMYMQVFYTSGVVGSILLVVFFISVGIRGMTIGARGHIALVLFGIWAGTGIGESANINAGGMAKVALGVAMACCTSKKLRTNPLWDDPQWVCLIPRAKIVNEYVRAKRLGWL